MSSYDHRVTKTYFFMHIFSDINAEIALKKKKKKKKKKGHFHLWKYPFAISIHVPDVSPK